MFKECIKKAICETVYTTKLTDKMSNVQKSYSLKADKLIIQSYMKKWLGPALGARSEVKKTLHRENKLKK